MYLHHERSMIEWYPGALIRQCDEQSDGRIDELVGRAAACLARNVLCKKTNCVSEQERRKHRNRSE